MKRSTKISFIVAVVTGIVSFALQYGFMYLPFGSKWLEDPHSGWEVFFPIWTSFYMLAAFFAAKKYQLKRAEFFTVSQGSEDDEELIHQWNAYQKMKLGTYLIVLAKICAFALPCYVLAYLDESKYLRSNMGIIFVLGAMGLLAFLVGKWMQKRYDEDNSV